MGILPAQTAMLSVTKKACDMITQLLQLSRAIDRGLLLLRYHAALRPASHIEW